MTDGSVWKQAEYYYEYRYAYRPQAVLMSGNKLMIDGMNRAVHVRRIS